jgi:NADH-quinone oxidoreductase subunit I
MGRPRKYTWWERAYYFEVLRGMLITGRHFWINVIGFLPLVGRLVRQETVTIQWPEVERPISPRWRGRHRLNKRDDGTVRCVACFCCATACPSECIHIVARERTDGVDEKEPAVFDIDLFRCVFCGMCVEACPCDAILMDTQDMRICQDSPDKFVISKDELMDW